jgi:hypothetical protein
MILVSDLAPNHADVLQAATNLDMSDRIMSLPDDILSLSSLCDDPQELKLTVNYTTVWTAVELWIFKNPILAHLLSLSEAIEESQIPA